MGVRNPPRLADATDLDETGKAAGFVVAVDDAGENYELVETVIVEGVGSSTDGQVLTADGAGGAAFESPDRSTLMVVVTHGATAATARPSSVGAVWWVGSVEPDNWEQPDAWFNTGDSTITGATAVAADAWQLEANTDNWLLEDSSGVWLLEA